jgi:hypothetical protein
MISNLVLKRRISLGKDKVTRNGIQIKDFNIIEKEIENYRFSNRLILPEVWEFEQLSEVVTQYDFLLVSYEGLIKEFTSCFEKEHPIVHNDMLISLGVFNIFRAIYHDLIVIRNCLSSRLEIQTNTVSRAFIEKSRILLLFSIDKEYAFDFISNVKKIDSYDRYSKYYKPSEVKKRILEIVKKEFNYYELGAYYLGFIEEIYK